jgi:saccharopine dehydrogenase-like NADP-dependent oxidoreductase
MKQVLVIGAGLSSAALVQYLQQAAQANGLWQITVADSNLEAAQKRADNHPHTHAIQLNASDAYELEQIVMQHDVVLSLLPPDMHVPVAKACIKYQKHLITASYVSDAMRHLHSDALKAGVLLLNEMGLDPGIDHMSAMKVIHELKNQGAQIHTFKSYCGGLVAPEYDDNPWHYKFTWNPRNVVLAGKSTASFKHQHQIKYIPPARIFKQIEAVEIDGLTYDGYPNRDSLGYIKPYGITEAHTVIRGTLRGSGYCDAWQLIVDLGLNDDQLMIEDADKLTYRSWLAAFIPDAHFDNLEEKLCTFLGISQSDVRYQKLKWLGLFNDRPIAVRNASSAQVLQLLLQQKWKLQPHELDMIVMQHQFGFELNGKMFLRKDNLVVKGTDSTYTAMAKTVGLPMGIAAKLLLEGSISSRGVQLPLISSIYTPVLNELEANGIIFTHQTTATT